MSRGNSKCRYIEKNPGQFVGDTSCEKLPVEICGAGCVVEEGAEECHEKQIDSLVDVPEEMCDLNPQKTCRLVTKLVPSLDPKRECTTVPKETCSLRFTQPSLERKPLRTEWCLDEEGERMLMSWCWWEMRNHKSGLRYAPARFIALSSWLSHIQKPCKASSVQYI